MIKPFLFLFFCFLPLGLYAQNIYEETFEGCDTQQFALESQTQTAIKDTTELIQLLTESIPNTVREKLRGKLKLQIIVYTNGTSCLLSYENHTKTKSSQLQLPKIKELVDTKLVWTNGTNNVSALVELEFRKKKIRLKRYGMDAKSGWHELKK